jgi:hypothetical protein
MPARSKPHDATQSGNVLEASPVRALEFLDIDQFVEVQLVEDAQRPRSSPLLRPLFDSDGTARNRNDRH